MRGKMMARRLINRERLPTKRRKAVVSQGEKVVVMPIWHIR